VIVPFFSRRTAPKNVINRATPPAPLSVERFNRFELFTIFILQKKNSKKIAPFEARSTKFQKWQESCFG